MKKKSLLIMLASLFAILQGAWAEATPQAIWCEDNATLYFINSETVYESDDTYDEQNVDAVWSGTDVTATPTERRPGFNAVRNTCTRVVFDESFASARPTSCYGWFDGFRNLTTIEGLEYLNTSKVTTMGGMFSICSKLQSLDLSGFNTAKVTNMRYMFGGCSSLTSLDLSTFNTDKVTSMESMFGGCSSLTSLDLSTFNTANVTDMSYMFFNCSKLQSLDLSSFNTAKVTNMAQMFNYCSSLQTIFVSDRWTTANVTESEDMFGDSENLVGGQETPYKDSNPKDKTYARIDGGTSNPGYLTLKTPQAIWCEGNATLYFINSAKEYVPNDTYDGQNVDAVWSGEAVTATSTNTYPLFNKALDKYCTKVVFDKSFATVRPTSCCGWFDEFKKLTAIEGLKYLNTSEVTNMGGMFNNCSSLQTLDLSSFNTDNVTDMSYMFGGCESLETLDLSSFNTANVTDMAHMFYSCISLQTLDLSSFNTAKVTDMSYMFEYCQSLQTIFVSDSWTTANVTQSEDMFEGCTSLVGGQGTTYNESNPKDMTYAHIDGGTSNPGYLTFGITLVDNDTQKPEGERNSDVILRYHGQTTNVTLAGRTLYKDGEWNTICLPFNVTLDGSPLEGATAKTLTDATMTGTTVTLTFGEPVETLTAGTPYIIKWEADTEQPTITNPTFEGVKLLGEADPEPISKAGGHVLFCGYYNARTITPEDINIYYMTAGSTLKHTGIDRTLNACRAYFEFSEAAAARQIVLDFGSDSTQGITSVGTQAANSHWFTVNGVRVENPVRKGLYIRNGKKTVVK